MNQPAAITALQMKMLVAVTAADKLIGAFAPDAVALSAQNTRFGKRCCYAINAAFTYARASDALKNLVGSKAFVGMCFEKRNDFVFLFCIIGQDKLTPFLVLAPEYENDSQFDYIIIHKLTVFVNSK